MWPLHELLGVPGVVFAVLLALAGSLPTPRGPVVLDGESPAVVVERGLAQYAEGEYSEAAAWLKLVALALPHVSAAADLALGDMYEHGLGVPQDVLHAYALYLHAGTGAEGPVEVQQLGRAALRRLERSLTEAEIREATLMASYGFREGLVPQFLPLRTGGILELAPAHLAATHGASTTVLEWGEYGMWIEQAHLLEPSGIAQPARDLLDVVFWRAGLNGERFERTLVWRVYTIERDALGVACEASLLVMRGFARLPPSLPADLRGRARLLRHDSGEITCEAPLLLRDNAPH